MLRKFKLGCDTLPPHCISSIDGHLQGRVSPLSRTTSCCPPPLPLLLSPILSRVSATGPLHGRFLFLDHVLTPQDINITYSLTLPSTRHSWGFSRPSDRLCISCQTVLSLTKDRATSNRLSAASTHRAWCRAGAHSPLGTRARTASHCSCRKRLGSRHLPSAFPGLSLPTRKVKVEASG